MVSVAREEEEAEEEKGAELKPSNEESDRYRQEAEGDRHTQDRDEDRDSEKITTEIYMEMGVSEVK